MDFFIILVLFLINNTFFSKNYEKEIYSVNKRIDNLISRVSEMKKEIEEIKKSEKGVEPQKEEDSLDEPKAEDKKEI